MASGSAWARIASCQARSASERVRAGVLAQLSNAFCASWIAASVSWGPQSATWAKISSVAGSVTAKVFGVERQRPPATCADDLSLYGVEALGDRRAAD